MTDWTRMARDGAFEISDFKFADGSELNVRLAYRTLGARNAEADNVVLMLHGTTGGGLQYLEPAAADPLFSEGAPLDLDRYFIVLPDAIGHGRSSKPSDGLGEAFPRYGYGDMVEAQHRLLVDGLGVKHLRLVIGASMGGMQTWLWGERYPDMMDALMPIASLPERLSGRNLLFRRLMIHMIQTDPNYSGAAAGEEVVGLGAAWNLFQLMTGGAAHMAEHLTSAEEIDHQIRAVARSAMQSEHPVDVIWEFDASRDYDPAPDLGRIKARLLAVNFADDMINPVELGGLACPIPQVANGRALTLPATPASRGHQTLRTSSAWAEHLQDLMRESEPR